MGASLSRPQCVNMAFAYAFGGTDQAAAAETIQFILHIYMSCAADDIKCLQFAEIKLHLCYLSDYYNSKQVSNSITLITYNIFSSFS